MWSKDDYYSVPPEDWVQRTRQLFYELPEGDQRQNFVFGVVRQLYEERAALYQESNQLAETLQEQLADARTELHQWRHWGDRMPTAAMYAALARAAVNGVKPDHIHEWMAKRPQFRGKER